jgi:hypothetical protein
MSTEGDEEGWEYYDDNEVLPDFWQVRYIVRTVRCGWDLALRLDRLAGDAKVTTVLAVLRIHNILVWIRIRIRGPMPMNSGSGSGSGSCYFRH